MYIAERPAGRRRWRALPKATFAAQKPAAGLRPCMITSACTKRRYPETARWIAWPAHALYTLEVPREAAREASPTACIIDSQMKSAEKGGLASTATASMPAS